MSEKTPGHRTLSDAQLEQLLDRALAPARLSDELDARILAATRVRVERRGERSVLARLAPSIIELAAVLGLAACAAWWVSNQDQLPTPEPTLVELELPAPAPLDARIDDDIALLGLQIDLIASGDTWDGAGGELDGALLPYELDVLTHDPMVF